MQITISQEQHILLNDLKKELLNIKQKSIRLSFKLLFEIKSLLWQFLISYKEYSLANIRQRGLAEVLMTRALRFFGLEEEQDKTKAKIIQQKSNKKNTKLSFRKLIRLILTPLYWIILGLKFMSGARKSQNKVHKFKNVYKE
ncbi:hypothetical protein CW751_03875 [Brumimicrobium salinarum]|uniref:Uncharacterized protein n=1 Tax=Brumimicrobium salinarum TaxID=2058658 RepID=A0A2I0R508_9FLAO|nr:hypothetical protein [Brumimicrobium salinarum]PKR81674.1 hypothetical protein CW751_03875 [Brumimicrobium salinarum]